MGTLSFSLLFLLLLIQSVYSEYYDGLRRKFTKYTAPPLCPKVVCTSEQYGFCSSIVNNSLILCPTCCSLRDNAECFASQTFRGTCLQKLDFTEPSKGYPGDPCSKDQDCLFGPRKCGLNGACQGVSRYGACKQSADCITNHFCSYGHCVPILPQGSYCISSEDCGRESVCLFTDSTSIFGQCTNLLSLEAGSSVLYKEGNDTIYLEGAEKLCRSGWVEVTDGRCSDGIQSKKKGLICDNDDDCPTSRTGVYATCRCGFNSNGTKYCDIEGGDDEWMNARNAFVEYIEGTKGCHNAARWTECGNPELYRKWRCAEYKALYYVELLNNPKCLKDMHASLPGFREMALYCRSSWFGLGVVQLVSILLLIIIALL